MNANNFYNFLFFFYVLLAERGISVIKKDIGNFSLTTRRNFFAKVDSLENLKISHSLNFHYLGYCNFHYLFKVMF